MMKLLAYDRSTLKSYATDAATIAVITASAILAAYVWSSSGINSVRDVHFGFGEVVSNLIDHGSYQSDAGYRAHRFPFIPISLYLISFISESMFITLVIKNLLVWFGTYLILTRLIGMRARWFYLLALLILISTRPSINLIGFEESLSPFFLLWMVIGLEKRHCVLFSVSLACLLLLKSSYWLPCVACALLWMLPLPNTPTLSGSFRVIITPILVVLCLGLAWSLWTYSIAGYFATPLTASSADSYNLFKGINPISNAVYPNFNNDTVDHLVKKRYSHSAVETEKEEMNYWRRMSIEIVSDDPQDYLDNLKDRLHTVMTRTNWAVNDGRLRQVQAADPALLQKLQRDFYDEKVSNVSLAERLKNALAKMTHIGILIMSTLYLWRSQRKSLAYLVIPFLFVASNLLIFVEPRHLFTLWTPLCYWTVRAAREWFSRYESLSLSGVRWTR